MPTAKNFIVDPFSTSNVANLVTKSIELFNVDENCVTLKVDGIFKSVLIKGIDFSTELIPDAHYKVIFCQKSGKFYLTRLKYILYIILYNILVLDCQTLNIYVNTSFSMASGSALDHDKHSTDSGETLFS